jgi:hypothetical protein
MALQDLHHPLFQSVILPLLLSLAGIGVLRATASPARAGAGAGLAVLVATIWLMGWPMRPAGVLQKLPWIFAGAWLAGIALDRSSATGFRRWLVLGIGWVAASWWLGWGNIGLAIGLVAAGLLVIAWLLQAPDDRADAVAAATVACLGLAAVCFAAGSLALFQLAVLVAAALGGAGLWLWPRPRIRQGAAVVAVAAAGWLAIAQASLLLIAVQPRSLALLALAFAVAPLLARRWRGSALSGALVTALAAGLLAGGALMLQSAGSDAGSAADEAGGGDPAYYGK